MSNRSYRSYQFCSSCLVSKYWDCFLVPVLVIRNKYSLLLFVPDFVHLSRTFHSNVYSRRKVQSRRSLVEKKFSRGKSSVEEKFSRKKSLLARKLVGEKVQSGGKFVSEESSVEESLTARKKFSREKSL